MTSSGLTKDIEAPPGPPGPTFRSPENMAVAVIVVFVVVFWGVQGL